MDNRERLELAAAVKKQMHQQEVRIQRSIDEMRRSLVSNYLAAPPAEVIFRKEVGVPPVEVNNQVPVPSVNVDAPVTVDSRPDMAPVANALLELGKMFSESMHHMAEMVGQLVSVVANQQAPAPVVNVAPSPVPIRVEPAAIPFREKRSYRIDYADGSHDIVTEL